jgi:Leucine-rich repeat (LRR) protein
MPANTVCPGVVELQQLLDGKLPPDTLEPLVQHVEHCSGCADTVEQLLSSDTLAEALRAPVAAPAAEDQVVGPLIERLRQLNRTSAEAPAALTQGLPAPGQASAAPAAANLVPGLDFLAPAEQPDELGRLAHYRVLRLLGEGGMGLVFQAEDTLLRRLVALKVLRPDFAQKPAAVQRFFREAQAAAAFKHEHIVTIHQVGQAGQVPFMVAELLPGEALEQRLQRKGSITPAEILRLGREIAAGLAAVHGRGLVHRDIKPGNIWLEAPTDRVKILDFGLARTAADETHLTQSGYILGTPSYMAPEQARGADLDARADLFSLGCVLYRLCTGRVPFMGKDIMSTLSALATETPPRVRDLAPSLPPALSDLTMKLLAKDPAQRPASAEAVIQAIQAIERDPPAPGRIEPGTPAGRAMESTLPVLPAPLPKPSATGQTSAAPVRGRWTVAAMLLIGAGVVAVGLALYGTFKDRIHALFQVETAEGTLIIETDDENVKVVIEQAGKVVTIIDLRTNKQVRLKDGKYVVKVDGRDDVELDLKDFELKSGGTVIARVRLIRKQPEDRAAPGPFPPLDPTWVQQVQAMAPADQVKAVAAELRKRNPGFDGQVTPAIENDQVMGVQFRTDAVTDLTPLQALPHLHALVATGSAAGKGKLADLSPLKGLRLGTLFVGNNPIASLEPVRDMPLQEVALSHSQVKDVTPLRGAKRLRTFNADFTPIRDLTPLQGLPLQNISLKGTPVADFRPLTKSPLRQLNCDFQPHRDAEALRAIRTLETINLQPAEKFWSDVDARLRQADAQRKAALWVLSVSGKLTILQGPTDLEIASAVQLPKDEYLVAGVDLRRNRKILDDDLRELLPLTNLHVLQLAETTITNQGVKHLGELASLTFLDLDHTQVTDAGLEHLHGLSKLQQLHLVGTKVTPEGVARLKAALPQCMIVLK